LELTANYSVIRNQTTSPLLKLPREIRDRVYDFALDLGSGQILHGDHNYWNREDLIHTCHQIYSETARTYYEQKLRPISKNGVSFSRSAVLKVTVARLTPSQRSCIKKMVLFPTQMMRIVEVGEYVPFELRNMKEIVLRTDLGSSIIADFLRHALAHLGWKGWAEDRGIEYQRDGYAHDACLLEEGTGMGFAG